MKKVIIPVSAGSMPPLVMMGASEPTKLKQVANPVQTVTFKPANPVTSPVKDPIASPSDPVETETDSLDKSPHKPVTSPMKDPESDPPNPVQTATWKPHKPVTSPIKASITSPIKIKPHPAASQMRSSNMRVVQTASGKKLLLTNVVNAAKPSGNKHLLLVPQTPAPPPPTSSGISLLATSLPQSQVNPVVPANAPHTVFLQPTTSVASSGRGFLQPSSQPIMLQVAGMKQPVIVKQSSQASGILENDGTPPPQMISVLNSSSATHNTSAILTSPVTTSSSPTESTTTALNPTPTVASSKKSSGPTTNPIMILNKGSTGTTTFKVVGKPVPVKLTPKFQKIAPKLGARVPILPVKCKKISVAPSTVQSPPSPVSNGGLTEPPAYLNIRVKEEPLDVMPPVETVMVDSVRIKEEVDSKDLPQLTKAVLAVPKVNKELGVQIKEEPKDDDQIALLSSDEQLRQVLEVTEKLRVTTSPKFFIRTSEGKLVSISSDEAQALGLDHQDKVENNQKKLMQALSSVKLHRGFNKNFKVNEELETFEQLLNKKDTNPNILISSDVNVKDFVRRHVPAEAAKKAAIMKTIGNKRVDTKQKGLIAPKSNTTIIGELCEGDQRFLRIQIDSESQEQDLCDVIITPLNSYRCPFCLREFRTKDHIITHIRIHTGERPYPCEVCGKRYRQRIDIIRHMRIHTGEKPFTCGLCNASFNQKSNLRSHMRVHTGERPVQCNVCGKGFSRNTHLKQHMKLHTGEKPFQCRICFRPFRFKSGLQAHERIHSGLKPYACSLCGRTFTQIVGLIRHERTHVSEKPFRCQSCGKSFDTREGLKVHVAKHTSERPFTCDLCSKTFTDKNALRCHRKKYHNSLLICVVCLREDFKDRIELREHLRAHERDHWRETPDGELVPVIHNENSHFFPSVDDTMENLENEGQDKPGQSPVVQDEPAEEIQVEVELEPDDPMENDESLLNSDDEDDDDGDESEYEEHELQIESSDPLA